MNIEKLKFWKRIGYIAYIAADFKTQPKDIHKLFTFTFKYHAAPDEGFVKRKFFKKQLKDGWTIRSITVKENI